MAQSPAEGSCMLSPVDQLMPRFYTSAFLVFKTDQYQEAVKKLNEGLDRATTLVPFLKGSVHKSPDGCQPRNQMSLSWSSRDPPLTLVETHAPKPLPSFATLKRDRAQLSVFQESLCPVSAMINYQEPGTKAPVLVIGVTRIDGGLILCLCAHHVVLDGAGMGMFLRLWGDCTRKGAIRADNEASFDPKELYHRGDWLRDASGYFNNAEPKATLEELLHRHPEYSLRSPSAVSTSAPATAPDRPVKCAAKILAISGSKLQLAKQRLSNVVPVKLLTVNNLLGAALWLSITRIRLARMRHDGITSVAAAATSKVGFAVNARSRLGSAVSDKSFLGNATMLKVVELPVFKLESIASDVLRSHAAADLSSMAPAIRSMAEAAATVTATHVGEVVSFADQLSDVEDVGPGWNSFHGLDLTYTSWANLGMYDCDFGTSLGGKPQFIRVPYMPYIDGNVLFLPRRRLPDMLDQEGGERIEVLVMLNERDMQALEEDELLRGWSA